jgi:hypothetical protein
LPGYVPNANPQPRYPVRTPDFRQPPPPPAPQAFGLEWNGYADGPAPSKWFAAFLAIWTPLGWLATAVDMRAGIPVVIGGLLVYWGMLPKGHEHRSIPGWTVLPLIAAFVGLIYGFGFLTNFDDRFAVIGWGLLFAIWVQLGLWLRERAASR